MAGVSRRVCLVVFALTMVVVSCSDDDVEESAATGAEATTEMDASSSTALTDGGSPARPPVVDEPTRPMAFDSQSGVVVTLVEEETWLFDVGTSTWSKSLSTTPDVGGRWFWTRLVYDPEIDRTLAVSEAGTVHAYDADRDTWTQRSPGPCCPHLAALDTRTRQVVVFMALGPSHEVWSYSTVDDRWRQIDQSVVGRPLDWSPGLAAYVPSVDEIVAFTGDNPGDGTPAPPPAVTHTFRPETGSWTEVDTDTPSLGFAFGDLSAGNEIVYADVTGRVIVFSDGLTAEYDPVERTWATYPTPGIESDDGMMEGPLARLGGSLVYDSVNERVLMFGGRARMPEGWAVSDDLWAYDPTTHEWSLVLEPTQTLYTS